MFDLRLHRMVYDGQFAATHHETFGRLAVILSQGPFNRGHYPVLIVVLGIEKGEVKVGDIDYRRLHEYKLGQALALLGLMVAYAILLRPAGFLLATSGFLIGGSVILGERRWVVMIVVSAIATFGIWYLVQEVLGIFLRPLPFFMGT